MLLFTKIISFQQLKIGRLAWLDLLPSALNGVLGSEATPCSPIAMGEWLFVPMVGPCSICSGAFRGHSSTERFCRCPCPEHNSFRLRP